MSRLDLAIDQIVCVRQYTLRLLDNTSVEDWFRQPAEGVTHIAWQIGHLAMAEYRLGLERIRGKKPGDSGLISEEFQALFRRESVPDPNANKYPSPAELRAVLDRVHERTLTEVKTLPENMLDTPATGPHPLFNTKLGALLWCAQHEMLHAGQIGLLRRLFGYRPMW